MFYDNRAIVWLFRCGLFVGLLSAVLTVIYLTPIPVAWSRMGAVDQAGVVVFRTCVVLALASLTGLVLWCTPLPKLYHASCDRPCHELDWPMICRVKLVLELRQAMGSACGDCPRNHTDCLNNYCLTADGLPRKLLTANGQFPGPPIQVCQNDILVVDVVNRVSGSGAAVHWRGQPQQGTPFMDGVSMVTQCAIPTFTTFQYKFRASEAGTHLWQVHTGNEQLDGLYGALIVRQSPVKELHQDLYDFDDPAHLILINEWPQLNSQSTTPLLINGRGPVQMTENIDAVPYTKFNITLNKRHRLRIAYSGGTHGCPISVGIDNHAVLIIAIDGHPIVPTKVKSFKLAPGERVDVVLTANQPPGEYLIKASTGVGCPANARGSALLIYHSNSLIQPPMSRFEVGSQSTQQKELSTVAEGFCSNSEQSDHICLPKIQSLKKLPLDLAANKMDVTLYLPFDFVTSSNTSLDGPYIPRINNLTFMFPPSPLLTQGLDIDPNLLCSSESKPSYCQDNATICECVHVINIPLHARVEIILIDQGNERHSEHVFHLHGHHFYVVGAKSKIGSRGVDAIKTLDRSGRLISRNLKNPVIKDTVSVPPQGVVALRFRADNPGYWLLQDQKASEWSRGLDVLLHVGTSSDIPSVPENFPRCGSWVGPEFFLI